MLNSEILFVGLPKEKLVKGKFFMLKNVFSINLTVETKRQKRKKKEKMKHY